MLCSEKHHKKVEDSTKLICLSSLPQLHVAQFFTTELCHMQRILTLNCPIVCKCNRRTLLDKLAIWKTTLALLPNQELSGAKSELQGETVGACSFHNRGGQPPYNLPARPPSGYSTKPASVFICTF